jgi:hypothetical protein
MQASGTQQQQQQQQQIPNHTALHNLQPSPSSSNLSSVGGLSNTAPGLQPLASTNLYSARLSARCPLCSNVFAYPSELATNPSYMQEVLCPFCHAAVKVPPAAATNTQARTAPTNPTAAQQGELSGGAHSQQFNTTQISLAPPVSAPSVLPPVPPAPAPLQSHLQFAPTLQSGFGVTRAMALQGSGPMMNQVHGGNPFAAAAAAIAAPGMPQVYPAQLQTELTPAQVKAQEEFYYQCLGNYLSAFDNPRSALVWLARAQPSRTWKLAVPKTHRNPKSVSGTGGYAVAYLELGLVLRVADTATGHWHSWYAEPKRVVLKALQAALMRRWKESPKFHPNMLTDMDTDAETNEGEAGAAGNGVRTENSALTEGVPPGASLSPHLIAPLSASSFASRDWAASDGHLMESVKAAQVYNAGIAAQRGQTEEARPAEQSSAPAATSSSRGTAGDRTAPETTPETTPVAGHSTSQLHISPLSAPSSSSSTPAPNLAAVQAEADALAKAYRAAAGRTDIHPTPIRIVPGSSSVNAPLKRKFESGSTPPYSAVADLSIDSVRSPSASSAAASTVAPAAPAGRPSHADPSTAATPSSIHTDLSSVAASRPSIAAPSLADTTTQSESKRLKTEVGERGEVGGHAPATHAQVEQMQTDIAVKAEASSS